MYDTKIPSPDPRSFETASQPTQMRELDIILQRLADTANRLMDQDDMLNTTCSRILGIQFLDKPSPSMEINKEPDHMIAMINSKIDVINHWITSVEGHTLRLAKI